MAVELLAELFLLAIAPVIILIFYIYIRDKYEKEPIQLLITGIFFGALISIPITFCERELENLFHSPNIFLQNLYLSFVVAAATEEAFKFAVLYFLMWRDKNFNEPFDGIVYATIISLGFAMIENILYVLNPRTGGIDTAFTRAIISVPGHGYFGISMGYFFALAKYEAPLKKKYMSKAILNPIFLHGLFNFILLCQFYLAMLIFILYLFYLLEGGEKKMHRHLSSSPFKNKSS